MSKQEQYAEILGVRPDASAKAVKKAYRDLRRAWQPERFSDQPQRQREAEEKLRKITEAYQELQALRRQARQQVAQSEDHANPADDQSAQIPEVIDSSAQEAPQAEDYAELVDNQPAKTPEVIDSFAQQAPQPEVYPAPAERQLAKLPKPKQPFVPILLPEKPVPGRSLFLFLSLIAVLLVLLLIFTQLYDQATTPVFRSQKTFTVPSPPSSHSLEEDLVDTTVVSPPDLSGSQPTAGPVPKSDTPSGYGLDTQHGSTGKRPSETHSTTEQSESARERQWANKKTLTGPIVTEEHPLP